LNESLYKWDPKPKTIFTGHAGARRQAEYCFVQGAKPGEWLLFADATNKGVAPIDYRFWGSIDVEEALPVCLAIGRKRNTLQPETQSRLLRMVVTDEVENVIGELIDQENPPSPEDMQQKMADLLFWHKGPPDPDPEIKDDIARVREKLSEIVSRGLQTQISGFPVKTK
jgi:hypothetical protein